jgi:hypothetical protein
VTKQSRRHIVKAVRTVAHLKGGDPTPATLHFSKQLSEEPTSNDYHLNPNHASKIAEGRHAENGVLAGRILERQFSLTVGAEGINLFP